jgi:hypothetical protein
VGRQNVVILTRDAGNHQGLRPFVAATLVGAMMVALALRLHPQNCP